MAPAAAPEPSFKKDEKVFCFHHELLYEAKVLEVRPVEEDKKNGFEYRVHYKGWKNTYVSSIRSSLRPPACHSVSHCGSHVCLCIHFTRAHVLHLYYTFAAAHHFKSAPQNSKTRGLLLRSQANASQLGRLGS